MKCCGDGEDDGYDDGGDYHYHSEAVRIRGGNVCTYLVLDK
jgi:hypothetical protein